MVRRRPRLGPGAPVKALTSFLLHTVLEGVKATLVFFIIIGFVVGVSKGDPLGGFLLSLGYAVMTGPFAIAFGIATGAAVECTTRKLRGLGAAVAGAGIGLVNGGLVFASLFTLLAGPPEIPAFISGSAATGLYAIAAVGLAFSALWTEFYARRQARTRPPGG